MTIGAIITIIATVLIIAVMAIAARREYDKRQTRKSFGPEYARVKAEHGGTRAADLELSRRTRLHNRLRPEPISADDQDFYATSWEHVQGGFLDDPVVALSGAEQLIAKLLAARGYPADDQGEQLALLSVQHGRTLTGYRQAQSVSERLRTDPASVTTEEKRTALMHYQAFFGDMLTVPGAAAPRRTRESEVKP
jgi:hypothetical protein